MDKMVELTSVSKRFGDFAAVCGVDLDIHAGEFLTLLGPSGCGKTTLLRMISGFETPSEGTIRLAGQDVTHVPPYRRDVNQVFQSYALFPHLNVRRNIAFGLTTKKIPAEQIRQRVDRVIDMVSLSGFEHRKPSELSGGQKQRVALARALVCEPKVLLLDEPLAALDAKLRRAMQFELKRLQSRLGITFVFVTHDQEEALVMSDRIAVFNKGRIEQIGPAAEVYHRPQTQFVADFMGQANIVDAIVTQFNGTEAEFLCRGEIQVTAFAESLAVNAKALISIRPEKIRLSKTPLHGPGVFGAVVREEVFRGSTDQLLLQTPGGLELTAIVANHGRNDERIRRGDDVFCQIYSDDIVMLRQEVNGASVALP